LAEGLDVTAFLILVSSRPAGQHKLCFRKSYSLQCCNTGNLPCKPLYIPLCRLFYT